MKEPSFHKMTKEDLTIYLIEHCVDVLRRFEKNFVVVFYKKCITNISQYPDELLSYNREESCTSLLI